MKKCVFAGTFDPFTLGHADTVKACLALFDEAVIAVAENRQKACMFSAEERTEMIRAFYASRDLDKTFVTLYVPAERERLHVSSTLVKNCIAFGKPYREYVPEAVFDYIRKRG